MGIEPTSEAWEASILPLYDARSIGLPSRLYIISPQKFATKFKPATVRSADEDFSRFTSRERGAPALLSIPVRVPAPVWASPRP